MIGGSTDNRSSTEYAEYYVVPSFPVHIPKLQIGKSNPMYYIVHTNPARGGNTSNENNKQKQRQ